MSLLTGTINRSFTFRLNFTLADLAVTSPAYNYFLDRIEALERKDKKITARRLGAEFPQYLQYERVNELVNSAILYYPLFVRVVT